MNNNNSWENLNIKLNFDKVPKFTQIRLETSNICSYNCFMCPRKKMTRKIGTMSIEDLNYVIDCFDYIKYELDFHLHGYGEALICDDLPERCKLITSRKPNFTPLIYTTLGYKKDKKWIESLFQNGLGKVIISLYGYDKETYKSVHGVDRFELVKENLEYIATLQGIYGFKLDICLSEFGKNYPLPKGYSHKKLSKLKSEFIDYLHSLGIFNITGQVLHNFSDGFKDLGHLTKTVPCSIVWGNRRQHISISWDLNVHACAYDYDCSCIWGNLKEKSLEEIFKSQERIDFIKSILEIDDYTPKKMCSEGGCFPNESQHDEEYEIIRRFMN